MNKTAPDAEEPAVTDNPSVSRSRSTMVVGASRGPGRGVATAFARAGTPVVAVVRATAALRELAAATPGVQVEVADAADPSVPGTLLDRHHPNKLLIVACASPLMRPLHQHTWDTFSANWNTDVRIAFHRLLREALLTPLRPGSRVIVVSSGAVVNGSPLSGGYAGAKATLPVEGAAVALEYARHRKPAGTLAAPRLHNQPPRQGGALVGAIRR